MSDDFYRIKRLPPYVIAEVNGMRAAARAGAAISRRPTPSSSKTA